MITRSSRCREAVRLRYSYFSSDVLFLVDLSSFGRFYGFLLNLSRVSGQQYNKPMRMRHDHNPVEVKSMATNGTKKVGEIKYFAQPNRLNTPNAPAYLPRAVRTGTVGQDQVLDFITQEGTTITRAEALAVFNGITKALGHFLSLGYHVNLPFADFRPTVQGRIDTQDPVAAGGNLAPAVRVKAGSAIRGVLSGVSVMAVDKSAPSVTVFSFQNLRDQSTTALQASDLCVIRGQGLSFDPAQLADGVFFVSAADQSEHRADQYAHTGHRSATFKAPAQLTAGKYSIVVRTGTSKGKPLSGSLQAPLDVN